MVQLHDASSGKSEVTRRVFDEEIMQQRFAVKPRLPGLFHESWPPVAEDELQPQPSFTVMRAHGFTGKITADQNLLLITALAERQDGLGANVLRVIFNAADTVK